VLDFLSFELPAPLVSFVWADGLKTSCKMLICSSMLISSYTIDDVKTIIYITFVEKYSEITRRYSYNSYFSQRVVSLFCNHKFS